MVIAGAAYGSSTARTHVAGGEKKTGYLPVFVAIQVRHPTDYVRSSPLTYDTSFHLYCSLC